MKTVLFVGLGNPEGKYFLTYHNLGFLAADVLSEQYDIEFKKKGNQLLAEVKVGNVKVLLLKPLTYMNNSGQAVIAVMRKFKIDIEDVYVFMDDLYIDKGSIRITHGGSGGGHNGIKSITGLVGSNKYTKIRIGIKPEKEVHSTSNYVLARINMEERDLFQGVLSKAVSAGMMFVEGKSLPEVQQLFNCKQGV